MKEETRIIGLASDHAGVELKTFVKACLAKQNIPFLDYGTLTAQSCDYPDFAHALAQGMERGECTMGIAICGTGQGMAITLNKHPQVRAALCWNTRIAHLAREHNNANVLVMPGRFITTADAEAVLQEFLATNFAGGRHERRINKI